MTPAALIDLARVATARHGADAMTALADHYEDLAQRARAAGQMRRPCA